MRGRSGKSYVLYSQKGRCLSNREKVVASEPGKSVSIPSAFSFFCSFFWCLNFECLLVFKRHGTYNQKKRSKRKKRDWQSLVRNELRRALSYGRERVGRAMRGPFRNFERKKVEILYKKSKGQHTRRKPEMSMLLVS